MVMHLTATGYQVHLTTTGMTLIIHQDLEILSMILIIQTITATFIIHIDTGDTADSEPV